MQKLIAALVKAQSKMPIVEARQDLGITNTRSSKYANLASLVAAARPHLTANGLAHSFQIVRNSETNDCTLFTTLYHESGDKIESEYPLGDLSKMRDQDAGKRISYAKRYSFKALVGIEESADPDDDGWGHPQPVKAQKLQAPPKTKPKAASPAPVDPKDLTQPLYPEAEKSKPEASQGFLVVKLDPEDPELKISQGKLKRLGFTPNAATKDWRAPFTESLAKLLTFDYTIEGGQ